MVAPLQLALAAIPIMTEERYRPTATSLLSLSITDYTH